MEEQQEKDNFWLYIGGFLAFIIALVVYFKGFHEQAIPTAYSETAKEVDAQIAKQHKTK